MTSQNEKFNIICDIAKNAIVDKILHSKESDIKAYQDDKKVLHINIAIVVNDDWEIKEDKIGIRQPTYYPGRKPRGMAEIKANIESKRRDESVMSGPPQKTTKKSFLCTAVERFFN